MFSESWIRFGLGIPSRLMLLFSLLSSPIMAQEAGDAGAGSPTAPDSVYGPAWRYLPPLPQYFDSIITRKTVPGPAASGANRVITSGTLFKGITISTGRGAQLTGGLDLSIQGDLGAGLFMSGHLTDRDLPIQPEGDTRTLDELDQVQLQITGKRATLQAGDFVLKGNAGPLARFERKLEGAQYSYRTGKVELTGALAGSHGRYHSISRSGIDGHQGPYRLTSHEGSHQIIIIAGSETVWLNGAVLVRGEAQDYTIDYNTGELFFTPRHSLRNDSRIVIDFEYTDLVYRRRTGYTSARFAGAVNSFDFVAFTERDDIVSQMDYSLSAENRAYLQSIGDDLLAAQISTAEIDPDGAYILSGGHYVWVGVDTGTHSVRFFNQGSAGEYRRIVQDNHIIYEWVPENQRQQFRAEYMPAQQLKLPERYDFYSLNWDRTGPNGSSYNLNIGLTNLDRNQFSAIDDDDNIRTGYALDLVTSRLHLGGGGSPLRVQNRLRGQGRQFGFRTPGRWDAVEFTREWALDQIPAAYSWFTGETSLEIGEPLSLSAELGTITTRSNEIRRLQYGGKLGQTNGPYLALQDRRLRWQNNSRAWQVLEAEAGYRGRRWTPALSYGGENRVISDSTGYQVTELTASIRGQLSKYIAVLLGREYRRDEFDSGQLETAHSWRLQYSRSDPRRLQFNASVAVNDKAVSGAGKDLSWIMGSMAIIRRIPGKAVTGDIRYRLERSVSETRTVLYDSIETGQGQFRYDPVYDTYIPDVTGGWVRYYLPSGIIMPVSSIKTRYRTKINLRRTRYPAGFRDYAEAALLLQGKLRVETADHSWSTYGLPSLTDTALVQHSAEQIVELSLQRTRKSPRYVLHRSSSRTLRRDQIAGGSDAAAGEASSRWRGSIKRSARTEIFRLPTAVDTRIVTGGRVMESLTAISRNHHIKYYELESTAAVTIGGQRQRSRSFSVSATVRYGREVNSNLEDLRVNLLAVGMGVQKPLGKNGRASMNYEYLQVRSSTDIPIPVLMAEGFPEGNSSKISVAGQIPLAKNLLLVLNLLSRQEGQRRSFRMINMEIRTLF